MRRIHKLLTMMSGGGGGPYTLSGFTYTKETYANYIDDHAATGCTVDDLGLCSDGVNHIYGLSYGDVGKPVIMITGGIHGAHEWHNAYILRKFMEYLVTPPGGGASYFARILARFRVYCIPCVNPYGYINNVYTNANNVNLNRNFDFAWSAYDDSGKTWTKGDSAFSEIESQIVRDKVLELDPVSLVDCHIEGGAEYKLHLMHRGSDNASFWGTSVKNTVNAVLGTGSVAYETLPDMPQEHHWARDQIASTNRYPACAVFETGESHTDTLKSYYMLNSLLQWCLTLDTYAGQGYPEAFTFTYQPDETTGIDNQISGGAAQEGYNWGISNVITVGRASWVRRGMLKFPLPATIPTGYNITSGVVTLYCTAEDGAGDYAVGFHRSLTEWYEGAKSAAAPDAGQDGSTWNHRNANGAVAWGAAGGQSGVDYAASPTVSVTITGVGYYAFDVTADVQAWDGGANNYGWMLINANEATENSRKQFSSSSEIAPSRRPKLVLTYI